MRPQNGSVVFDVDRYVWQDAEWMAKRGGVDRPIYIYEVHLGSWKKSGGGEFPNFRVLAVELVLHCNELGFTHVELMPVMEHLLDESWGYLVNGFFCRHKPLRYT